MTTKEDGMSNELERVARALNITGWTCGGGAHEPGNYDTCPECKGACDEGARAAIAAMTPTPQVVETVAGDAGDYSIINGWLVEYAGQCTCAGGGVYGHENGCGYEPIALVEDILKPTPTPDVDVLAEVRALLPTDTKRADDYGRLVRAIRALLDREATQ